MSHPRKRSTEVRPGKTPVYFFAPTELVQEYRRSLDGRPMSHALRKHMAEYIAAGGDEAEKQAA